MLFYVRKSNTPPKIFNMKTARTTLEAKRNKYSEIYTMTQNNFFKLMEAELQL